MERKKYLIFLVLVLLSVAVVGAVIMLRASSKKNGRDSEVSQADEEALIPDEEYAADGMTDAAGGEATVAGGTTDAAGGEATVAGGTTDAADGAATAADGMADAADGMADAAGEAATAAGGTTVTTDGPADASDEAGSKPGKMSESPEDMNGDDRTAGETEKLSAIEEAGEKTDKITAVISGMTMEQKIYQLFVVTPEQLTGVSNVTAASEATRDKLKERPVGGVIYFADNLTDSEQTKEMLGNINEYAMETEGMPLFLCVDEEGGRVARIANNPAFGVTNTGFAADVKSVDEAYECGLTIGNYLKELGFNTDFAPDVDVLTNEANKVIGPRSFGSDPEQVTQYGKVMADGLHEKGILCAFKHFPGHGATTADTHEGYAYTNKTYEEMMESELIPFKRAQEYGIDFVMTAHISVPQITGDDIPCSMSEKMITDILRGELGYDGLVITDAMNMGAISEKYTPEKSGRITIGKKLKKGSYTVKIKVTASGNAAYNEKSETVKVRIKVG